MHFIRIHIIMSQYSLSYSSNSSPNQISIFLENALNSCILCVIAFCCWNFQKNLQEKIWEIVKFQQKGYTVAWISFHFRHWEEKMTRSNQMKFRLSVYCKLSLIVIRPPIDKPSPLAPVISLHRLVQKEGLQSCSQFKETIPQLERITPAWKN